VKVTDAGLLVCAPELNDPTPETIDQAAVLAPPPKLAPLKVNATGEDDWHIEFGPLQLHKEW